MYNREKVIKEFELFFSDMFREVLALLKEQEAVEPIERDREKVINGLEWILADDRFGFGVNWETGEPRDDYEKAGKIITDTITLLKERGAIKPTINEYGEAYCVCGENVGIIPNNKSLPSIRSKYCSECGRRMKWE